MNPVTKGNGSLEDSEGLLKPEEIVFLPIFSLSYNWFFGDLEMNSLLNDVEFDL
jgi:hypothetical protein